MSGRVIGGRGKNGEFVQPLFVICFVFFSSIVSAMDTELPNAVAKLAKGSAAERKAAAEKLAKSGAPAVPLLINTLPGASSTVRVSIAQIFGQIGAAAKDAVPALMEMTGDSDTRPAAFEALGKIGEPAVGALTGAMKSDSAAVRTGAARTLGVCGKSGKPGVPLLIKAFSEERSDLTSACATSLAQIALEAPDALPAILEAAKSKDFYVRSGAVQALGGMASSSTAAADELVKQLGDANAKLRRVIGHGLQQAGPKAAAAVPYLVRMLGDSSEDDRELASTTLAAIGTPAIAPVLAALDDDSLLRRRQAASTFKLLKTDPSELLPELSKLLGSKASHTREAAALALGELGEPAKPVVPQLGSTLQDAELEVRLAAGWALAKLEYSSPQSVINVALEGLKDPRPFVRSRAAQTIEHVGPPAVQTLPALIDALRDGNSELEISVGKAIAATGPDSLQKVLEALKHFMPDVRRGAGWALRYGSYPIKETVEVLKAATNDQDGVVRHAALDTLGLAPGMAPEVAPICVEMLVDWNDQVRSSAQSFLQKFGASAHPALMAGLRDPRSDIRRSTMWTVARIGNNTSSIYPMILEAMKSDLAHCREYASLALAAIKPCPKDAVAVLTEALNDGAAEVRAAAATALASANPEAPGLLPTLTRCVAHPNMAVRTQALMGLRRMGSAARGAVPALLEDLNDDDRIYRADVKSTLDTIAESDAKLQRTILLATNEAAAIEACMQAAEAQAEYFQMDLDGDGVKEFAQALEGDKGLSAVHVQKNQLLAGALGEIQSAKKKTKAAAAAAATTAYKFKILNGQGSHAPGGERAYIAEGNMVNGFAILAYPTQYAATGVNSFTISSTGVIYKKDLGEKTAAVIEKIEVFDPDNSWTQAARAKNERENIQTPDDF